MKRIGVTLLLWLGLVSGALAQALYNPTGGGGGGTPGGSNTQVQYNNAGAFGGITGATTDGTALTLVAPVLGVATGTSLALTDVANPGASTLSLTGGTGLTTSQPLINGTQTWNAGGVTFTGLKLNITSSASAAASLLLDLQVASATLFNVRKDGRVSAVNFFSANDKASLNYDAGSFLTVGSAGGVQWSSALTNSGGAPDIKLVRDAAGILAQRNGVSAQKQRWYGSYTDASNGYWGEIDLNTANTLIIGSNSNGTGAGNQTKIQFNVDGVGKLNYGVTTAAVWTSAVSFTLTNGGFTAAATGYYQFGSTRSVVTAPADGQILLQNQAQTSFTSLQFGGTTSSFPALKRSSAALEVRLADDSTSASLLARSYASTGAVPTLTLAGGTCAGTVIAGGSTVGTVTLTGICAATNTMALTVMPAATTGYVCDAIDRTLGSSLLTETATTTTSVTFTFGGTTGATDVIAYKCLAY